MLDTFHSRPFGRGEPIHVSVKSALLTAGALILTLLAILILIFGIFASRAT